MPPEIVLVTVVTVLAGTLMITFIAKMYFKHLSEKAGVSNNTSSSLTSGELERMLRRVVDESNEQLLARIKGMEERWATVPDSATEDKGRIKSLPAHEKNPVLEDLDVPDDLAAISKRKSRTV